MENTSNMIQFSRGMKTSLKDSVCEEEYEEICKKNNIFEYIPDDRPVKLYFDADHIFSEKFENYSEEVAKNILQGHIFHLDIMLMNSETHLGCEPNICVAESHSKRRIKNGNILKDIILFTNFLVFFLTY